MFDLPRNSFYAMAIVLALLMIATVIRLYLASSNKKKDYTELRERIQSWWWMIGILFSVLVLGETATIVFFGFLSFLALKEFLSLVPLRQVDRRVVFWTYLAIPIQFYWVAKGWYGMFVIFVPVYLFLFIPIRMVLIGETRGFIRSAGILQWSAILTVFFISHIAYLVMLPIKNPDAGNIGLVLYLLFVTQFNDVCQYIWGKSFGKHKIVPTVSPNKTWEGFIGGLVTITIIAGGAATLLTPMSFYEGLVAGVIISAAGFFGDVVFSSVKRDLNVKDSGQLIPGHGGILDRIDSLIFTAPIFFHYLHYLHY